MKQQEHDVLFSLIIPTYNSAATIHECLNSIVEQEFTSYEIILQDGVSKDNTLEIAAGFAALLPKGRIKIRSEEDKGIYDAMNKGAASAIGQYLYFLGSDDYLITKHVLTDIAAFIKKKNFPALVYGSVLWRGTGEIYDGRFSLHKLLERNICHQAIFLARKSFQKYGPFDTRFRACADWDLNIAVFKSERIGHYPDYIVADYNVVGFSSNNRDEPFEKRMAGLQAEYYSSFINRFKRQLRYYRNRIFGNAR